MIWFISERTVFIQSVIVMCGMLLCARRIEIFGTVFSADVVLTGMQTRNWKKANVVHCAIQWNPSSICYKLSILGA